MGFTHFISATLIPHRRVKSLESQISELEAEASRLLRALDSSKEAKAEVGRTERRKADEAAKELASQVRGFPFGATRLMATQVGEIESLKVKVKQYSDYDEIKRELEIMKVDPSRFAVPVLTHRSTSSFPVPTSRATTMFVCPIRMPT